MSSGWSANFVVETSTDHLVYGTSFRGNLQLAA